MQFAELDYAIRACRKCSEELSAHPVDPFSDPRPVECRPIVSSASHAPFMLVGQAPGIQEYRSGHPFQGQAGSTIRDLFAKCGLRPDRFDAAVYQTSAVKCFPGRKLDRGRATDRTPSGNMRGNCRPFLAQQIERVDPWVIVCLGGVSVDLVDELRNLPKRSMTAALGRAEEWGDRIVIMVTHTSGSNRLLNEPENQQKQARGMKRLRAAVQALGMS